MNKNIRIAKALIKLARRLVTVKNKIYNYYSDVLDLQFDPKDKYNGHYYADYYLEFPISFGKQKIMNLIDSFRNYDCVQEINKKQIDIYEEQTNWQGENIPCYNVCFRVWFDQDADCNAVRIIISEIAGDLEMEGFKLEQEFDF